MTTVFWVFVYFASKMKIPFFQAYIILDRIMVPLLQQA